jgi:salicylate hydroxylase
MIRRPRAQSVWEGSVRAGDIYEGYGKHGSSDEGRRRDLEGQWDFVWHRGVDDDMHAALKVLQERGVFRDLAT